MWKMGGTWSWIAGGLYVLTAEFNRQTDIGRDIWKLEFVTFALLDTCNTLLGRRTSPLLRDIWSFAASGSGLSIVLLNVVVMPLRLVVSVIMGTISQILYCEELESSVSKLAASVKDSAVMVWEDGAELVRLLFVEFLSQTVAVPCEVLDLLSAIVSIFW
jgi:hypothetical protein